MLSCLIYCHPPFQQSICVFHWLPPTPPPHLRSASLAIWEKQCCTLLINKGSAGMQMAAGCCWPQTFVNANDYDFKCLSSADMWSVTCLQSARGPSEDRAFVWCLADFPLKKGPTWRSIRIMFTVRLPLQYALSGCIQSDRSIYWLRVLLKLSMTAAPTETPWHDLKSPEIKWLFDWQTFKQQFSYLLFLLSSE